MGTEDLVFGIFWMIVAPVVRLALYKRKRQFWWSVAFFLIFGSAASGMGINGELAAGIALVATLLMHRIAKKKKKKWELALALQKAQEAERLKAVEEAEIKKNELEVERIRKLKEAEIKKNELEVERIRKLKRKKEQEAQRLEAEREKEKKLAREKELQQRKEENIHKHWSSRFAVCVRCGKPLQKPACEACGYDHASNSFFMLINPLTANQKGENTKEIK